MGDYKPIYKLLWRLSQSGLTPTINANGDSTSGATLPVINIQEVTDLVLTVGVPNAPTGTTPTLMVQVDMQDAEGNWITQVVKLAAAITATGTYVAYGGLHIGGANAVVFTGKARVSWTVTGAGATFTGVNISLAGR